MKSPLTSLDNHKTTLPLFAILLVAVGMLLLSCGENPPTGDQGTIIPDPGTDPGDSGEGLATGYNNGTENTGPAPSVVDSAQASIDESMGRVLTYRATKPVKPVDGNSGLQNIAYDGKVMVVLSFDDGPHSAGLGTGRNYTETVLQVLRSNSVQDNIKAMFCVQTHVLNRGGSEVGQELIKMMHDDGHVVAVHTGSTADHVNHKTRVVRAAYDANGDGVIDDTDGENALDCDMHRAIDRITALTGEAPGYVRPTYGANNAATRKVYEKHGLNMVLWDIDSEDSLRKFEPGPELAAALRKKVAQRVARGHTQMLVLFHDIKSGTVLSLDEYIIAIFEGAQDAGKEAVFPATNEELRTILNTY